MGKNKHKRFAENDTFECLVQPLFEDVFDKDYPLKGNWRKEFFGNDNPIVLELGCGRGEYTVDLARANPNVNYIGVDIKGARMWRGAKSATEEGLKNVGFLRTRIEFITSLFAEGEVDGLWITFADPQLKKRRADKRLTSHLFLNMYSTFLKEDGVINLKTDSQHLHLYTRSVIKDNELDELLCSSDVYSEPDTLPSEVSQTQTTYEKRFLAEGKPITFLRFSLCGKKSFKKAYFELDETLE